MAQTTKTVTTTTCDVFGVTRTKMYRVVLTEDGMFGDIIGKKLDLSKRGIARLKRFIERGMSPPGQSSEEQAT